LDIGCAYGFLLDGLGRYKNKKMEINGCEISEHAYEFSKKTVRKGNIINCEFLHAKYPDNYFDVIFLIGTIEHLYNPKEITAEINKKLKKGGFLVVTTIDTKGVLPFYMLKPPEHLFYFSHKNIKKFFEKYGFALKKCEMYFVYYFLHDLFLRLYDFSRLGFFKLFSKITKRAFENLYLKIPTNEMLVIAQKK
jgi:2-polyprenyl-3-methyl-5-hydroxy-6-metoxy-1,4-benzoquinol methylase